MDQPLEGIRILELGTFHAGPGGSAILGDMGAEVIKIEQPHTGDPMRHQMRYGQSFFELAGGRNMFFEVANRNKKSITIDMKQEKGREIAYRLAAKCDVFSTNFRPKVIEKMGMTYEILSQLNPRIIYAEVSAYGPQGPDRDIGGFDTQGQARSGIMYAMGEPEMPPLVILFGVIDQVTSITISQAITTALLMRERTGIGQKIDTSLLGSALYLQYINVFNALWLKQNPTRHDRTYTDPLRNHYCCKDGKWLSISNPGHWENRWPLFCRIFGKPELARDPRFETRDKRYLHCTELIAILDQVFLNRPRDEWIEIFNKHDIISCAVNTSLDLDADPQVIANKYIVDFDDPTIGKTRIPGFPVHFSQAETGTRSLAPALGEHTEQVLKYLGGYSEEEIMQFQNEGLI